MKSQEVSKATRIIGVRLDPGEDLLEGIRASVKENGIRTAMILNGVGSLTSYHFHVVSSTELPPENEFVRGEGAFDIINITGMVMDGRVHAHITFSDTEKAMGGHLEEGCNVLTFAILSIAELPEGFDVTNWDTAGKL